MTPMPLLTLTLTNIVFWPALFMGRLDIVLFCALCLVMIIIIVGRPGA